MSESDNKADTPVWQHHPLLCCLYPAVQTFYTERRDCTSGPTRGLLESTRWLLWEQRRLFGWSECSEWTHSWNPRWKDFACNKTTTFTLMLQQLYSLSVGKKTWLKGTLCKKFCHLVVTFSNVAVNISACLSQACQWTTIAFGTNLETLFIFVSLPLWFHPEASRCARLSTLVFFRNIALQDGSLMRTRSYLHHFILTIDSFEDFRELNRF